MSTRYAEQDAAAMSEEFHGRPARKSREVEEAEFYRSDLADLGGLEALIAQNHRCEMTLRFGHDVRFACEPSGRQIYFVGGDQSVDLSKIPGVNKEADVVDLGLLCRIEYFTAKHHLARIDADGAVYVHDLGEEDNVRPRLIYDRLNERLSVAGGNYEINWRGVVN